MIPDSAPCPPSELDSLLPDVQAGRRKRPKRLMDEHPAGRRESSSEGGYVAGASNLALFVNGVLPEIIFTENNNFNEIEVNAMARRGSSLIRGAI